MKRLSEVELAKAKDYVNRKPEWFPDIETVKALIAEVEAGRRLASAVKPYRAETHRMTDSGIQVDKALAAFSGEADGG